MLEIANQLMFTGTAVAQVIIVVILIALVASRIAKKPNLVTQFVTDNAILIAFLVALGATVGSLFYSEIAGFDPCRFCWIQRIFMYSQVITLGLALKRKEMLAINQSMVLSVIGGGFGFYQYLGQMNIIPVTCLVAGYSASCTKVFVIGFGYITIPLMALTIFSLIFVVGLTKKLSK